MKIDKILNIFSLRAIEKDIFKVCFDFPGLGATEISRKTGINRTSVYDILEELIQKGLIIETQKLGVKDFYAQNLERINLLIEEKQKEIIKAKIALEDIEKNYNSKNKFQKPKLEIYEGRKELQQMMKDILLYRNITIYSFWPVRDIVKILGRDFYENFHKERIERNIKIKVIWPFEQLGIKKKYKFLNNSLKFKREARIAPKNISFNLGYAIYENKVRFLSSRKEDYGFLIESAEMADMMKIQFDVMWEQSKILKNL